jgi:coenzyme Q-binding protein COQ10
MPAYHATRSLPYTPAQMYALVADVALYPEFVPWCQGAIIHEQTPDHLRADLVVGEGPFQGRFQSLVHLSPYEKIDVSYQEGPLKYLKNTWLFRSPEPSDSTAQPQAACSIDFSIDFEFRNPLLDLAMRGFFDTAVARMLNAFEARAHKLYGQRP